MKVIITALIKNIAEPIKVLLSLPTLYFPKGHLFPLKAAIGSHIARIRTGK